LPGVGVRISRGWKRLPDETTEKWEMQGPGLSRSDIEREGRSDIGRGGKIYGKMHDLGEADR